MEPLAACLMKNSVASLDPVFHLWVSNTTSQEAIRWLLEVSIQFGAWAIFYRDMNNHQESPAVTNSGIYFPPDGNVHCREKQGQTSYYGLKFNFKHLHDLETVPASVIWIPLIPPKSACGVRRLPGGAGFAR